MDWMESSCMSLVDAGGVLDVENGIAHGIKLHTLKLTRQDAGRPLARGDGLHLAAFAL